MANMRSRIESRGSRVQTLCRSDGTGGSYAWLIFLTGLLLAGCATSPRAAAGSRPFLFEQDTFCYANELVLGYHFDDHRKWTPRSRAPKTDYTRPRFFLA